MLKPRHGDITRREMKPRPGPSFYNFLYLLGRHPRKIGSVSFVPSSGQKSHTKELCMKRSTQPIPQGFHTVTPSLIVRNGAEAIEFYKKALGAQELFRMAGPDGKIGHAELKIGDSI